MNSILTLNAPELGEMAAALDAIAAADAAIIANAVTFNCFLRKGPGDKISENFDSRAAALAFAAEIEAAHPGRKVLITAVNAEGRKAPLNSNAGKPAAPKGKGKTAPKGKGKAKPAPETFGKGLARTLNAFCDPNSEAGGDAAMARAAKPARKSKAAKPAKAKAAKGKAPKAADRPAGGKRAAILADAAAGNMPAIPDFSAPTHARFRAKLAAVADLASAGDLAGLKAYAINPVSSSPKAIMRYRDLCITALEARAAQAAGTEG